MCHYITCTCVQELHLYDKWQTPKMKKMQNQSRWNIFFYFLYNRFLASIKLKALFCSWNAQIAFNGFMAIMFWHFPKLDEWFIQKDMNVLLGGCRRLHATISLALKQILCLRKLQLLPKVNSTQKAQHITARSRGNMKDTNKSFNKLTVMTERSWEERKRKTS